MGSQNPVKVEAVKEAFAKYFDNIEVIGMNVNSKVSNQPINDETFEGAKNRALELKKMNEEKSLGAHFFVGIEGGIINVFKKWFAFGGMCIIDKEGRASFGASSQFELPESITKHLLKGVELGDVMDKITGVHNSKQKSGAVGFLTKEVIDRKSFYVQGLVVALVPFINQDLYFTGKEFERKE